MAIGERIHFFRILRGMTQKYLGTVIGFDDNSADVRIAQYETGKRKPKELYLNKIAEKLGVSPQALDVPNIDSYEGLMHTLFALEDIYGLRIDKLDDELCISIKKVNNPDYKQLRENFDSWYEQANKLRNEKMNMTSGVTTTRKKIIQVAFTLLYHRRQSVTYSLHRRNSLYWLAN